jgi:predicted PurR-regulated permease PerM
VATVFIIVMMVILPLTLIVAALAQEAAGVYGRFQSGELNLVRLFQQVLDALPNWLSNLMNRFGVSNLGALQERMAAGLQKGSEFLAGLAINFGQSTADFVVNLAVMLYLLFFLLREGDALSHRFKAAIPLRENQRNELMQKFTVVIRATVKGNILIALLQGALGGLVFWFLGISAPLLWAVVMAFLSLLPAIGAGLVWMPVAIYLLATGALWQGVTLIAFGLLVIGLVDNLLRPILVGKDTKLPDYVVLISTLGGIEVFGLNGFVIGPVIAAMFIAVWDLLSATRRDRQAR